MNTTYRMRSRLLILLAVILPMATRSQQPYAQYIPQKGNTKPMPVVFFFDPHGEGSLPLNKYRTLAEAYGFILVGSNLSKNGNDWPTTENIWNRLIADVRRRLIIDERRLYVCGFSGGAKVASFVAIQHPGIRGVVAGGAGLPDGVSADNFPFSLTLLAGEGDMNLTDLVALSASLDKTQTRHRLIGFDGKHEWAPLTVMDRAFAGWQLEASAGAVLGKYSYSIYIGHMPFLVLYGWCFPGHRLIYALLSIVSVAIVAYVFESVVQKSITAWVKRLGNKDVPPVSPVVAVKPEMVEVPSSKPEKI